MSEVDAHVGLGMPLQDKVPLAFSSCVTVCMNASHGTVDEDLEGETTCFKDRSENLDIYMTFHALIHIDMDKSDIHHLYSIGSST